jgi:hypothetical protein
MRTSPTLLAPSIDNQRSDRPVTRVEPLGVRLTAPVRAALPGLALAVSAILFGFAMGGLFGLNEAIIKDRLGASASAVTSTVTTGTLRQPSRSSPRPGSTCSARIFMVAPSAPRRSV